MKNEIKKIEEAERRAIARYSFDKRTRTFEGFLRALGYSQGDIEYVYGEEQRRCIFSVQDIRHYFEAIKCRSRLSACAPVACNQDSTTEYEGLTTYQSEVTCRGLIVVEDTSTDKSIYQERPEGQQAILDDPAFHIGKPKQVPCAKETFDAIYYLGHRGRLILAAPGTGKTFVGGSVLKNLLISDFFVNRSISPWKVIYITKASVAIQTRRDLDVGFGISRKDVYCFNIEQLRTEFGKIFVEEQSELKIVEGEPIEQTRYIWKEHLHPCVIVVDECQQIKNKGTIQTELLIAATRIEQEYSRPVVFIFISATPFTKVAEARAFVLSCKIKYDFGWDGGIQVIDEDNWNKFAKAVAYPADPNEHSPAAVERLMPIIDPYIAQMKNVRSRYHAKNRVEMIDFQTDEERQAYATIWDRYLRKKARLKQLSDKYGAAQTNVCQLALLTVYRNGAEGIRAPYIAEWFDRMYKAGYAPGAAVCFKNTIVKTCYYLIKNHGWKRDDISLIWGGSVKVKNEKKEQSAKLYGNKEIMEDLESAGVDIDLLVEMGILVEKDELDEKTPEQIQWEKKNRLYGIQNIKQRQIEIDRFQSQKSRGCIYTFKSGGAGLSLHHWNDKTRPRIALITPVYSAIELVQGLGRFPRIASISDTPQALIFYRGTIEEKVAESVARKLSCLKRVVRQRESWDSIIKNYGDNAEYAPTEDEMQEAEEILEGVYLEDDEDNEN